jgi:hypothetical protein
MPKTGGWAVLSSRRPLMVSCYNGIERSEFQNFWPPNFSPALDLKSIRHSGDKFGKQL